MRLDVNADEVVRFTAKLERLRSFALPSAIRGALNSAAFDVKQKTMPEQTRKEFINRSPNFFKANSSVDMARGVDVNQMRSTIGFKEDRLRLGTNNFAVRDLEQQERAGNIGGKSFIPLDSARVSGPRSLVKPANRLSRILKSGKFVIARNLGKGTKKQLFIKAIHKAGTGGYVLGSTDMGENILWRVDSINGNNFSLTPLYDYRGGRKVKVKGTGFMEISSLNSAKKMNGFFISNAKYWIDKLKK